MPTIRTPIRHEKQQQVTPEAVRIFKTVLWCMEQCETLETTLNSEHSPSCMPCKKYIEAIRALGEEFQVKPWEYTVVLDKDMFHATSAWGQKAIERWDMLMAAIEKEVADNTADALTRELFERNANAVFANEHVVDASTNA